MAAIVDALLFVGKLDDLIIKANIRMRTPSVFERDFV